jgi:hypothetical protein
MNRKLKQNESFLNMSQMENSLSNGREGIDDRAIFPDDGTGRQGMRF